MDLSLLYYFWLTLIEKCKWTCYFYNNSIYYLGTLFTLFFLIPYSALSFSLILNDIEAQCRTARVKAHGHEHLLLLVKRELGNCLSDKIDHCKVDK